MEIIHDMEIFQDIENFLNMEIILDMEVKHHTLYCTTISRIKQLFHETYKLYACALH